MSVVCQFMRNDQGSTAIEYGLICSLLFLAIVGAINQFTSNAQGMYATISGNMH